jgi:signal transduction histidine kinase
MDIQSIILISVSLLNAILALVVFINNRQSSIHKSFSLFVLGTSLWAFTNAATRLSSGLLNAWIWSVISYVSAINIALAFFYFSLVFPAKENRLQKYHKLLLYFSYPIIVLILAVPGITVKSITLQPWKIITGPGLLVFGTYFLVFMIWGFVNLIKKYRIVRGLNKAQIKYIFLGTLISSIFGIIFNLVFPLLGDYRFVWLGPIFAIFMIGFAAYAITRYRLMDIRLVIKRSTVFVTAFVISVLVSAIFCSFIDNLVSSKLSGILGICLGIIIFLPIRAALQRLANKYFFPSLYSQHQTLRNLSQRLTTIIDLDKLINNVTRVMAQTLGISKIAFLLKEQGSPVYHLQKIIGFKPDNGLGLLRENLLTEYLIKTGKPLVYDELGRRNLGGLKKTMKAIGAHLCLPIISQNRLIGIIILGKKVSGEAYTLEDLELLETLTIQTSLAIENARLYNQVQDLNQNLEAKVSVQTKNIQALLSMKSGLLNIISHQLRTPTSIFRGMLSLVNEKGKDALPPKEREEFIRDAFTAADRLVVIINTITLAHELQGPMPKLALKPVKVEVIIKDAMAIFTRFAQEKHLELEYEQPDKKLPLLMADANYLKSALEKLIDNALWYTPKGGKVIISTIHNQQDKTIEITIKDTGIGLTNDDKKNLFQQFSRGRGAKTMNVNSSGLGLYIVKKIAFIHRGKITAQSQGANKGSTFTLSLPVMQGAQ